MKMDKVQQFRILFIQEQNFPSLEFQFLTYLKLVKPDFYMPLNLLGIIQLSNDYHLIEYC